MKNLRNRREKGITLIALVVTIVVLIILATISINAVIGQGGIIEQAKRAKNVHDEGQSEEETRLQEGANGIAQYYMEDDSKVTVDGIEGLKLTKDNVATYLGKVVKNYKPTVSTVTVGEKTYTVSTQYRLYYVDFDKKYNKDEVSIFLKADCTSNNYVLGQDETSADASNIKIKALNPALYETGVTLSSANKRTINAVTFLTNTSNWNSLKTGASLANKVNYVVGAPSVEMMFDSYNTKYGLKDKELNTGTLNASTDRVKLFYQYTNGEAGYKVGPNNNRNIAVNGYYYATSNYTVKTDSAIDSMYYPGTNQNYWLASPPGGVNDLVLGVLSNQRRSCGLQLLL